MALVLTKPNQLSTVAVPGYAKNLNIVASHSAVVDQSDGPTVKWIVTISDLFSTKVRAFEVLAIKKGANATYNIYGIVGDTINTTLSVTIVGGKITLSITNNEIFDIQIQIIHIGAG